MATKNRAPLPIDATDFIRGAGVKSEPVIIGQLPPEIAAASTEEGAQVPATEVGEPQGQGAQVEAPQAASKHEQAATSPSSKGKGKPASKHEKTMPWESANPKVKNYFQVRMPEPLGEKLKWIQQHSVGMPSVHELVLTTLEEMAERRIKEINRAGRSGN